MDQMHEEIHIDIKEEDHEEEENRQVEPQAHNKTPQHQEQYRTLPRRKIETEETIINIPILTTTTTTAITKNTRTRSSLSPTLTLSAYDTDSSTSSISSKSTVSSTCCTRHGEEIYMERGHVDVVGVSSNAALDTDADDDAGAIHYKTEHRKSWPIFILAISLIEIAIFVYDFMQMQQPKELTNSAATTTTTAAAAQQQQQTVPLTIPTDSVLIYRPDRRLEMWRFISYMFLHANLFHLGFNVVVQLFYGIPLEVMHGSARIAIIYFAGVFAGSLGTSVVDSEVYLVGASGGVYALLAAHLANITLNYAQMKYAVAQLLSVLIFVTCDLGYAFYTQFLYVDTDEQHMQNTSPDKHHRYHHNAHTHVHEHINVGSTISLKDKGLSSLGTTAADLLDVRSQPPVSYIAHLTGALAGLTIGLLVLKNFERRAYKNLIWWLALGIYSAFTVFAIAFNLINTMTAQLMEEQGEVITQHLLHDLGVS